MNELTRDPERELLAMQKEIAELNSELAHFRSDNEMLKETVVRLAMQHVGVTD